MERYNCMNKIQQYIQNNKNLYDLIINYLDDDDYFKDLTNFIDLNKIAIYKYNLYNFMKIIMSIANNYYKTNGFFDKIERIIIYIKKDIINHFTKDIIFNIFKSKKPIIKILLKNSIIKLDKTILERMLDEKVPDKTRYFYYFYPEIKSLVNTKIQKKIESEILEINPNCFDDFLTKREIGANDSYLCTLIREDSIEEFIIYVNKKNISLTSTIPDSIFETNSFLIENEPTLIEYATFYGSIQIFKYLQNNKVKLKKSLWIYAIHSNNAEMIDILQENNVKPPKNSYMKCIKEAIKCHNNNLVNYIKNYLISDSSKNNEKIVKYSILYSNYEYFPVDFYSYDVLFYLFISGNNTLIDDYLDLKRDAIIELIHKLKTNNKYSLFKNSNYIDEDINIASDNEKTLEIIYNILIRYKTISLSLLINKCRNIEKTVIPSSITYIENNAFINCHNLRKVIIPSTLTKIGKNAFRKCINLETVSISPTLINLEYESYFENNTKSTDSINEICEFAFSDCTSLKYITIPFKINTLDKGAFYNCSSLKNISLPYYLEKIDSYVFYGCKSLKVMKIPKFVYKIGSSTFENCSSLSFVSISSYIGTIPKRCFGNCKSLKNFSFPTSLTKIEKHAFEECISLSNITIPSSVISIGKNAFLGCSIKHANIPSAFNQNIKRIGFDFYTEIKYL